MIEMLSKTKSGAHPRQTKPTLQQISKGKLKGTYTKRGMPLRRWT